MKKNKYNLFYLLLLSMFAFTACGDEDIFQEDPDSIVIENFYTSEENFTLAIRGVYSRMKTVGYYGGSGAAGDLIVTGDLLTDNLITNPNGRGTNFQSHSWLYNDNLIPSNLYTQAYVGIARANIILNFIDNLSDGAFKDGIMAEALAARAAYHFDVARFFSQIPTQSASANSSLGIAYVTEYNPTAQPARLSTVQEVYDNINADLDQALSLIGSSNAGDVNRFNENTIRALIGRVALHQGDYNRVINVSQSVVNAVAPAPASQLGALWTSASSAGVLFELPFIVSDGLLDSNYSQGTGNALIPEWSVDKDFFDTYNPATEPERINAYFLTLTNTDLNETWILVNKYINGALQQGLNNGRYFRVEEAILNLAEAFYMTDNDNMARNTLDILRNARYSSFVSNETGDDLFDAIMLERRKELPFESSDRWFTLKRLQGVSGIPSEYTQGVVRTGNGHLADGTGTPPVGQTLPAGDHRWQLPIQQSWIIENPNIEQNPGY